MSGLMSLGLYGVPCEFCWNNGFSYPRSTEQTCGQKSRAQLSPDDELSAKESLALYCKPVELYNIIRQRAIKKPPSLQRCLRYKIEAKRKKRIQISVSISGSTNTRLPAHGIFPLHVLLARSSNDAPGEGHSPMYRFSRACVLTSFCESGDSGHTEATFTIPNMKSLSTSQVRSLDIILISRGQGGQNLSENCSENHAEYSSPQKLGGQCFWGKIPIDSLGSSLDSVTLSLGHTVELTSEISMNPGFIEPSLLEHDSCLTFCSLKANATGSYKLKASIDVQEAGARDMRLSPYNIYSYDHVPQSLLPKIIRLRTGNVLFNYKYYKNLYKSEVTEDFTCSFCLVPCGSFKGLECHLTSSHDLFRYEFWVSKEYQAVNVSLKIDTRREELLTVAGNDPGSRVFFYRSSRFKRCKISETTTDKTKDVYPHITELGSAGMTVPVDQDIVEPRSPRNTVPPPAQTTESGSSKDAQDGSVVDYVPKENGINVPERTALQSDRARKLLVDLDDPSHALLKKREFFHSQKAQRMELDVLYSDHDSEDELDHDIADFEDRTLLGGFSDVAEEEKRIMHMWNSFKRRQRILADGHVPWACEAFTHQHGQELVQNPRLRWCWRVLMIKLWNHGLLNGRTMNICNKHLEVLESQRADPKQS
ncbi:polycomb group protein EMF2B-like isoform X1 [Triticum urartu]|uniref:polycomb group protein EMF2B-like isoform X1 n=1 Tax=Triticum urartu TaxID=4572 RepID=UPI0020436327|nr:polycomb group protein EMF2B-like isoform X1 [Triticum urartu]